MSSMYKLKSYDQVHVTPADILYKLPSYHSGSNITPPDSSQSTSNDASDLKLAQLLKESLTVTSVLVNELMDLFKTVSVNPAAPVEPNKNVSEPVVKKNNEDKSKAVKVQKPSIEKKTKTIESHKPAQPTATNAGGEDNKSFDGHSRGHAVFAFKLQDYEKAGGSLEVTVGPNYMESVKLAKAIADGRNVGNNIKIKADLEAGLKAVYKPTDGKERKIDQAVDVLSFIGHFLGIYSPLDPHLAKTTEWLAKADEVLSKGAPIDPVIRELSCALGPFDLLNKTAGVTVSDVVLYSLIKAQPTLPNNVETFVKRITEALSSA